MERVSVGLADLDTVDLVTGSPGGDQGLWVVAGDWSPEREALDYTQLMIKLASVLAYAERLDGEGHRSTTVLHSTGEPPVNVLEFLRERGIAATVGAAPRTALGRPDRFPNLHDGSPDLVAIQGANAARFADEHGLDGSVDSLILADDALEERRHARGLAPGEQDEDFADGDLIVLAGAYAGEVLRRHTRGARWWLGPPGSAGPLHLRAGLGHGTRVGTLRRARRYLQYGSRESLHELVSSMLARLNG
jgi:hypothetical protein